MSGQRRLRRHHPRAPGPKMKPVIIRDAVMDDALYTSNCITAD